MGGMSKSYHENTSSTKIPTLRRIRCTQLVSSQANIYGSHCRKEKRYRKDQCLTIHYISMVFTRKETSMSLSATKMLHRIYHTLGISRTGISLFSSCLYASAFPFLSIRNTFFHTVLSVIHVPYMTFTYVGSARVLAHDTTIFMKSVFRELIIEGSYRILSLFPVPCNLHQNRCRIR